MVEPLAPGEHVDLDSGVAIVRGGSVGTAYPENHYRVKARQETAVGEIESTVLLEDEEIRQLAEAAGYEVSDPP